MPAQGPGLAQSCSQGRVGEAPSPAAEPLRSHSWADPQQAVSPNEWPGQARRDRDAV